MNNIVKHEDQKQKMNTFKDLATLAIKSGCYGSMTIDQAMNVMLSASDLGVSPMKALNGGFHVIKGKITMAGHLISDRIRASGHSIKVVEHTREKCVIIGVRKDNGDSYKCEFDMEDAKMANLLGSPTWKSYPKDMLYNRAIARLGRVLFSDVVGACYSEDEGHDIKGTPPEKRECKDPDSDIIISVPEKGALCNDNLEDLKEMLKAAEVEDVLLEEYLKDISTRKNQDISVIVESAVMPELFERFKATYCKWMARRSAPSDQEEVAV